MAWLVKQLISMASAARERERQLGFGALSGPSGTSFCSEKCLPSCHHLQLQKRMAASLKQHACFTCCFWKALVFRSLVFLRCFWNLRQVQCV